MLYFRVVYWRLWLVAVVLACGEPINENLDCGKAAIAFVSTHNMIFSRSNGDTTVRDAAPAIPPVGENQQ